MKVQRQKESTPGCQRHRVKWKPYVHLLETVIGWLFKVFLVQIQKRWSFQRKLVPSFQNVVSLAASPMSWSSPVFSTVAPISLYTSSALMSDISLSMPSLLISDRSSRMTSSYSFILWLMSMKILITVMT